MIRSRLCKRCGRPFVRTWCQYCSDECRVARSPAIYRFICPDGRSYVGSRNDCRARREQGIQGSNARLQTPLKQYPAHMWSYEVLQELRPGCLERERLILEQHHIDRYRALDPAYGFNILPASGAKGGRAPAAKRARANRRRKSIKRGPDRRVHVDS
jgi:hypothetical protein